ncbi:MAG: class B sortase [Lachnospiraceae bacterium]
MKNKKIVYVENKDDLVEILNNEVEKSPQNKRMPIILMILLSMAIIAAGYFGFRLWRYYQDYQEDQKLYGDLREAVLQITDESEQPEPSTEIAVLESDTKRNQIKMKKEEQPFDVDWVALKEVNEDIIGWVYFTGLSQISYPILQADNNEYYVHRTYDLSSDTSKAGCIFMDYRMADDFSSPYSIIYGHNVRDGSMLSDLVRLKDQTLYDEEPYFWILTPEGNYRYQIFSIFQCHRAADVFQRSFDGWGEDFFKWQSELKLRNSMQGDVKLREDGHVIAFSTCVPNSFDRTIVCGTYIDGDSIPDPSGKNK